MEFRVLGPLEVRAGDGRAVALGGARPRAVLARLLVARGTVVSADALIDDLYGGAPPPSALPTLHSYVSNLRRALEPGRLPRARPGVLIGRPPGYLLAADQVDADRFGELLRRAELRPPVEALACLEEALGLWRGTPYGEFAEEPWAVTEVGRLRELRLVALERRANVLLELGRAQAVITGLETEAVANPLRERLWSLLAMALYRTGRQAEALGVLRHAAELLADQLGLDPSPELRALEQDILRQSGSSLPAHDAAAFVSALPSTPAMRGRDRQLAELTAVAARAADAGLSLAAVSGEPGIGKTLLLEEFGTHCAARLGQLVLRGRCHDAEGTPPLWPWIQVLEALEHHCPPPDRQALAGLLDAGTPAGPADGMLFQRNQAVAHWLSSASRTRPLVIVLDDLQWADAASLDLLRDLVVLLQRASITLVMAFRTGCDDPLGRLARYDLLSLRVSGLEPAAVRAMAADLGVELDADAAVRMAGRTAGNPFLIRESLRLLAQGRAMDAVPDGVAELVRQRLDALAGDPAALEVAAVIGREFDPAIVTEVAGQEAGDLLDRAVRSGLLQIAGGGRLAFAHDLVREALVRDLPPLRKAAVHRDLAAALAARPSTDVAVIAHHAVQAGQESYGQAVHWATAAAEQAGLRLAYQEAATWWGHAVAAHDAAGGDPAQHVELLLCHTRALLAAGDPATARRSAAAALRTADRVPAGHDLVVRALTALDTPALWVLRDPYETIHRPLVHRLETALDDLPATDSPERALLLARLAQELYDGTADPRCDTLSAQAVAMARRLGDPHLLIRALNARHLSIPQPQSVPELIRLTGELHELARRTRNPRVELLAGMMDTHNRLETFDIAGADQAAARCEALLERLPLPWPRFQHTLWRANRLALDGRFEEADQIYDDADVQARDLKVWHARPTVAAGRIALSYHRGAIADAAPLIAAVRAHPTLHHDATTLHLCAQGRLDHARHLNGGPRPAPPRDWSWLSATCLRAAAVAAVGRTHECRTVYTALLPYSGRISALSAVLCLGPVDWYLALLAAATGRHDTAAAHLTALEQQADAAGLHWWRDRAAATRKPLQVATSG
ncbi:BTAD domain-containing putative transcriptional regulator [Nonomuraea sp. JJY05]|uniref:BTAD domain-containing putative transcriptional regulator n=1 Tax=Nonomuraea sp. JJY05 TaxID=3350255 RepID=UPI00373F38AD